MNCEIHPIGTEDTIKSLEQENRRLLREITKLHVILNEYRKAADLNRQITQGCIKAE